MIGLIYNVATGEGLREIDVPAAFVDIQVREGEAFFPDHPRGTTHILNGQPITIVHPVPPPTQDDIRGALTNAVQAHLNATASQRNYDNIFSACTYATSTDPVFRAEGQACVEWRDAVWRRCYDVMDEVNTGHRGIPTPEELIALLPPMVWP